ncbi:MAG: AEC family transporter [Halothece sp.]
MSILLSAIAPVIFIILIGFVAAQTLALEKKTLSQLTVYILAPALTAHGLYQTTLSTASISGLVLGFAIASLILYLIALGLGKLFQLPPPIQKSLIAITLFPNTGNLGLSFITFSLGEAGLERAIIYLIAASILMFGLGPALLSGGGFISSFRLIFKLPLIWAIFVGLLLRLFSAELPFNLEQSIEQLGFASIPVALVILGMELAHTPWKIGIFEVCASSLRLLMAPLIAYGIGRGLHLEGLDLQVLVLQSAMPVAVNAFILSTEFGGHPPRVARTIVISTIMSFGTLPLLLWILTR